jgi:hypothetical protein
MPAVPGYGVQYVLKRSVVKFGSGSLTIALPPLWCEAANVKAGDKVELVFGNRVALLVRPVPQGGGEGTAPGAMSARRLRGGPADG